MSKVWRLTNDGAKTINFEQYEMLPYVNGTVRSETRPCFEGPDGWPYIYHKTSNDQETRAAIGRSRLYMCVTPCKRGADLLWHRFLHISGPSVHVNDTRCPCRGMFIRTKVLWHILANSQADMPVRFMPLTFGYAGNENETANHARTESQVPEQVCHKNTLIKKVLLTRGYSLPNLLSPFRYAKAYQWRQTINRRGKKITVWNILSVPNLAGGMRTEKRCFWSIAVVSVKYIFIL